MSFWWLILEQALFVLAGWTLGFHLCLFTRAPSFLVYPAGAFFYVILLAFCPPRAGLAARSLQRRPALVFATLALGASAALFTLCVSRPDRDDVIVFHRALVQIGRISEPLSFGDTQHNTPGLPQLSILHAMTSYEHLMTLVARPLGIDPLWACQNLGAAIPSFLLPFVFFLSFRHLRLSPARALAGSAFACLFLIVDGHTHFAYGNFAFVRLAQGKCILVALLVPFAFLAGMKFLARPSRRNFVRLFAIGVAGPGLSGSALFLIPISILALAFAYLLSYGLSRRRLARAALCCVAPLYCLAIVAASFAGAIEPPADTVFWDAWERTWWKNLALVVPDVPTLARNVCLLVLAPLAALPLLRSRLFLFYGFALILGFVNPLTAPILIELLKPAAFWRLVYLFPVPLCAGLLVQAIPARIASRRDFLRAVAIAATLAAALWAFQKTVLAEASFKRPSEYKLPKAPLAFAREAGPLIPQGANVLAPEVLTQSLGLTRPDLRFESCNWDLTVHIFGNAGRAEEGKLRIELMNFVSSGIAFDGLPEALANALDHGVRYTICAADALAPMHALLRGAGVESRDIYSSSAWTMIELSPPSA